MTFLKVSTLSIMRKRNINHKCLRERAKNECRKKNMTIAEIIVCSVYLPTGVARWLNQGVRQIYSNICLTITLDKKSASFYVGPLTRRTNKLETNKHNDFLQ